MVNSILSPDTRALIDERAAEPVVHHQPKGFSDRFALGFTKLLRFSADTFFAKRYGHRAIVLETVAADRIMAKQPSRQRRETRSGGDVEPPYVPMLPRVLRASYELPIGFQPQRERVPWTAALPTPEAKTGAPPPSWTLVQSHALAPKSALYISILERVPISLHHIRLWRSS